LLITTKTFFIQHQKNKDNFSISLYGKCFFLTSMVKKGPSSDLLPLKNLCSSAKSIWFCIKYLYGITSPSKNIKYSPLEFLIALFRAIFFIHPSSS